MYTGEYSSDLSRTAVQSAADSNNIQYESRQSSARNLTGGRVYYSNNAFPKTNITNLYTVNYYDSYEDTAGMSVPSLVLGQTTATGLETKGLPTVSKVKVLTKSNWNTTIYGYDKKGRGIYNKSANSYLGITDAISSELDFVGKVKQTVSVHAKGSTTVTTIDVFSYDHMGRLLSQKQKINNFAEELIVLNTYDELGKLKNKKVGGEVNSVIEDSKGLQTIDYTYNIRGWLKQINNPVTLGNDLFAMNLNYNSPVATSTLLSKALYNGNISETQWKTAKDNVLRTYGYQYDALNRIIESRFSDQGSYYFTGEYNSNYNYDKNGNLSYLYRNVWYDEHEEFEDNELIYNYSGNKLSGLSLEDGEFGDSDRDYFYDANGNLTREYRNENGFQGIYFGQPERNISYNHLNLPVSIEIYANGAENDILGEELPSGNISYVYDATGLKLEKKVTENGISRYTYYSGNYVYEKVGETGSNDLKFFAHSEGYVDTENGFNYVYQFKDHLGNVRLSYINKDKNYNQFIESDFESGLDGWTVRGTGNVLIEAGRLKAEISRDWEGVEHTLDNFTTQAGEEIYIKFNFDKGNTTSNVRLYLPEYNASGDLVRYNNLSSNLQTGYNEFTLTLLDSGNTISKIKIDKDNTNYGVETYFYIDNVIVTKEGLDILEVNDYYPFGLKHKGDNFSVVSTNTALKRRFGGKEYQDELDLGLYDFHARNYDPTLGRWMNIDPLADSKQQFDKSPYIYTWNNPVNLTDFTGKHPDWNEEEFNSVSIYGGKGGESVSLVASSSPKSKVYVVPNSDGTLGIISESQYSELIGEGVPEERSEDFVSSLLNSNGNGDKNKNKNKNSNSDVGEQQESSALSTMAPIALTAAAIDGPLPIGDVVGGVILAGAASYDATQRVYVTYTMTNSKGQTYVGRTSGYGNPYSIMMSRFSRHHMRAYGFGNPVLDRAVQGIQGYPAIRGREQQMIDFYGGIGSKNVGNRIRGVSGYNPAGFIYHGASNIYFGQLHEYTGFLR